MYKSDAQELRAAQDAQSRQSLLLSEATARTNEPSQARTFLSVCATAARHLVELQAMVCGGARHGRGGP